MKMLVIESFLGKIVGLLTGLILTTYCVRYPQKMAFLRTKTSYSLSKPSNLHAGVLG